MSRPKAAIVLMSILLATTALADDDVRPLEFCRDLSLIANQVMIARQRDKPMSETIPIATDRLIQLTKKYGREIELDEAEELAAGMVMDAYRESIEIFDDDKKLEVTEFENDVFKECYEQATSDEE